MNAYPFASCCASLPPIIGTGLAIRTLKEYLIFGGAVLLVTGATLVWAIAFRKAHIRRRSHHRHRHPSGDSLTTKQRRESKKVRSRNKHHHQVFPRQPTRAETGGLPPVRGSESPPPEVGPH